MRDVIVFSGTAHEPLARFVFPEDQNVYARFRRRLAETGTLDDSACGKYLDKPSGFYAAEAARLYKLVGAEKRMAFIVKKFGL